MDNSKQKPDTNFIINYMERLEKLIKEPPYLMFFVVCAVLLMTSLIWRENYVRFFFILLIYSMTGVIWRHAVKDMRGRIKVCYRGKFDKINLFLTCAYQLINLVLIVLVIILLAQH